MCVFLSIHFSGVSNCIFTHIRNKSPENNHFLLLFFQRCRSLSDMLRQRAQQWEKEIFTDSRPRETHRTRNIQWVLDKTQSQTPPMAETIEIDKLPQVIQRSLISCPGPFHSNECNVYQGLEESESAYRSAKKGFVEQQSRNESDEE